MPKDVNIFEGLEEGKNGSIYKQLSQRISVLEGEVKMLTEVIADQQAQAVDMNTLKEIVSSLRQEVISVRMEMERQNSQMQIQLDSVQTQILR